jgi:hypothetical protein
MSVKLSPIGFWSYARQDDERKLNLLRLQLAFQVQQRFGREAIKIFQDVAAIPPGDDWEAKIRDALDDSSFFIPIITPNFLESKWCDEEFFIFLDREQAIAKEFAPASGERRIFPILYVDIEDVSGYSDQLLPALKKAQWLDIRDLIYKDPEGEEVRARLGLLAKNICKLLRRDLKRKLDREAGIVAPPEPVTVGAGHVKPVHAVPLVNYEPASRQADEPAARSRNQLMTALGIGGLIAAAAAVAFIYPKLKPEPKVIQVVSADPARTPPAAAANPAPSPKAEARPNVPVIAPPIAKPSLPPPASSPSKSDLAPAQTAKLDPCVQAVLEKARSIENGAQVSIAQATKAARTAQDRANAEKAAHPDTPSGGPWTPAPGEGGQSFKFWGDTLANQPNGFGIIEYADGHTDAGQFNNGITGYGVTTTPSTVAGTPPIKLFAKFTHSNFDGYAARVDTDGTTRMDEAKMNKWAGYGATLFRDKTILRGQLPSGNTRIIAALYGKDGHLINAGYFDGYTYYGPYDGAACPV